MAALGAVAYQLANIGLPQGSKVVGEPALPAFEGETSLANVKLDDLVSGKYALAVSSSDSANEQVVACGEIGGTRWGDNLLFGLSPHDQRGIAGAQDLEAVVEMGGDETGSSEGRATETSVRGFWKAYRTHMGA